MQEGRSCAAIDLEYGGPFMDFLRPEGFCHCLYQVARLREGGSLTMAPVCSTWVWVILGQMLLGNQSFERCCFRTPMRKHYGG